MEKRKPRSYKIADKPYKKAKRKAKGELATMIESWVTEYGNGNKILAYNGGFYELEKDAPDARYGAILKSKLKSKSPKQ